MNYKKIVRLLKSEFYDCFEINEDKDIIIVAFPEGDVQIYKIISKNTGCLVSIEFDNEGKLMHSDYYLYNEHKEMEISQDMLQSIPKYIEICRTYQLINNI